jgi:hypothetical protein
LPDNVWRAYEAAFEYLNMDLRAFLNDDNDRDAADLEKTISAAEAAEDGE